MRKLRLFYLILLTAATSSQALAQMNITGVVKTVQGEGIVGANILIRGTAVGTTADVNGNFALQIPANLADSSLYISSVGYVSQTIPIKGQTLFTVTLQEDTETLGEVVVTGYQTQARDNITGAVGIVSPDLINKVPVSGIDQALQGRVPGVVVTQNTGAPGGGVRVRIRGIGSINSSNDPSILLTDCLHSILPPLRRRTLTRL